MRHSRAAAEEKGEAPGMEWRVIARVDPGPGRPYQVMLLEYLHESAMAARLFRYGIWKFGEFRAGRDGAVVPGKVAAEIGSTAEEVIGGLVNKGELPADAAQLVRAALRKGRNQNSKVVIKAKAVIVVAILLVVFLAAVVFAWSQ